jgi:cytidylate kinase
VFKGEAGGVCQEMMVSIGGYPGSGTTTLSKKIKEAFGMPHVYAGQIFREMAAEKGVTLAEFSLMAEKDESIDGEVDRKQKEMAQDNTVVEGRMTAFIVDADLKIWLSAPLEVRVERVAKRENILYEESMDRIMKREASERKRYKKYYNTSIDDLSVYDLVINTELWDAEGVFTIVKAAIEVRTW